MALAVVPKDEERPIIFDIAGDAIAKLKAEYQGLDATKDYKAVVEAIAHLRGLRTGVEARRVALKAWALEHGRKVDGRAKELTALLEEIEGPLKAQRKAIDDAKENERREKEAAELRRVQEELRVAREAEEAKRKAEREEEDRKQAAARAEIEAERKKLADERAKVDADRRAVVEQQAAIERAEKVRKAREERDAREAAEREIQKRNLEITPVSAPETGNIPKVATDGKPAETTSKNGENYSNDIPLTLRASGQPSSDPEAPGMTTVVVATLTPAEMAANEASRAAAPANADADRLESFAAEIENLDVWTMGTPEAIAANQAAWFLLDKAAAGLRAAAAAMKTTA